MPSRYIPILIYAILAAAFPAVTLIIFKFIRPDSTSAGAKLKPYERGIPPESAARGRYSVPFYIAALLLRIFYLGTSFRFPRAAQFNAPRPYGLGSTVRFLG